MSKDFKVPEISKGSLAGQVVEATYDEFKALVETADNVADVYAKVDLSLGTNIELAKDIKRAIDAETKVMKAGEKKLREYTAMYMGEKGLKKLEGAKIKSITYQEPKIVKKALSFKQIKKGRGYVNVGELSRDDLIEMLEEKGVKTRVVSEEIQEEKEASIRVVR